MPLRGKIIKALAGFYYVESQGKVYQTRARGQFRKKGQTPFVGDDVEFSAEKESEGYLLALYPRKNALVRPAIVNIDQAILVMSATEPAFHDNLLDRFLTLLEFKKIKPIIYISKLDLLENPATLTYYQTVYRQIGYDWLTAPDDLISFLTDKWTVIMGQTGVGKSTLLNQLAPQLHLKTNEISTALGRGRHTTRVVSFYSLHQGKVADTPGFSLLDYEVNKPEDLNSCFREIAQMSRRCKFRSCSHTHEPNCAVKESLEIGEIAPFRFENYLQLLNEIQHRRETYQKTAKKK